MHEIITKFLEWLKSSSISIDVFDGWHFGYIVLILGITTMLAVIISKKSKDAQHKLLNILAILVIATYILDFFMMPLNEGEINIDKLPFHICTFMGVCIPFAQFNKKFSPIKDTIVTLSIVASLMYITYPGSALGGITPWCYKVVQTFLFHGLVFAWGVLNLTTGEVSLSMNKIYKPAIGIVIIILWAFFGSLVYSPAGTKHDWFFVRGTTFPFVPEALMPFTVFAAVYAMCVIITLIYLGAKKAVLAHTAETTTKEEVATTNN